MTKKTLAVLIALAMLVAITPVLIVSAQDTGSTGTIEFTEATDPGIIDPTDPIIPPDWGRNWGTSDLNFGRRGIDILNTRVYWTNSSTNPADPNYNDSGAPNERNSLVVLSGLEDWTVTVKIAGFFIEADQTIDGFLLNLIPLADSASTYHEDGSAAPVLITPRPATIFAGAAGVAGAAATIATGQRGLSGFHFIGGLTVPANTASEGAAQAVLTWTYGATP